MGPDRENIVPSLWEQMIGIDKKLSFLLQSVYLYNLWYLAALAVKCFILNKN